jgi:hypothetical protein
MKGYLGETDVTDRHPMSPTDGALLFICLYGGFDGAHHKDWVLDQVARILNGAPIIVKEARWDNGHSELRYSVGTSEQYEKWVHSVIFPDGADGEDYGYSKGIAP